MDGNSVEKKYIYDFLTKSKSQGGGDHLSERSILSMFPSVAEGLSGMSFPIGFTFKQKLYHYLNNDFEIKLGLCGNCGSRCKFLNLRDGYRSYCSVKCSSNSDEKKAKTRNTNLMRYGVTNPSKLDSVKKAKMETCLKNHGVEHSMQSDEVKERYKKTCVKKYGVDNPLKDDDVKMRIRHTNAERYGTDCVFCSESVKKKICETNTDRYGNSCFLHSVIGTEKVKESNKVRYGVEHPMQSDEVKEKYKETCMRKYGVEHPLQSEYIKSKVGKTNLNVYGNKCSLHGEAVKEKTESSLFEEYGTKNAMQSIEVQDKRKRTMVERYGVEHPLQSDKICEKMKTTNVERYGTEFPSQTDVVKKKVADTNMERYGVPCPLQSERIKDKIVKTNNEKYGVDYPMQSKEIRDKSKRTCKLKYGTDYSSQSDVVKEKTRMTNLERYGVEWFCQTDACKSHSSSNSKPNLEFANSLDEIGIAYEREHPISSFSYDFRIGDFVVEINPTITHNSILNVFGEKPLAVEYHAKKSASANECGLFCIHVWDWDDKCKVANMFKPKKTLYARSLELREVSAEDASSFLNAYHLQNTCKGHSVRYGLYMDDTLVEVMTFGKPRYNRNYEWELLRLCTHSDYIVVGGAERLFRHFVNEHNPKSVISYCDNSKFNGNVYIRLGFAKKSVSQPTKHWYNLKSKRHITDNFLRQRGFDQLFGTDYGKGTSNEELMLEYGFLPVYDCGQTTFIWSCELPLG